MLVLKRMMDINEGPGNFISTSLTVLWRRPLPSLHPHVYFRLLTSFSRTTTSWLAPQPPVAPLKKPSCMRPPSISWTNWNMNTSVVSWNLFNRSERQLKQKVPPEHEHCRQYVGDFQSSPGQLVEETVLLPSGLSLLITFVKNPLTIHVNVFFWTLVSFIDYVCRIASTTLSWLFKLHSNSWNWIV